MHEDVAAVAQLTVLKLGVRWGLKLHSFEAEEYPKASARDPGGEPGLERRRVEGEGNARQAKEIFEINGAGTK